MAIQRTQGFSTSPVSNGNSQSNTSAQVRMGASGDSVTLTQNASKNPKGLWGIPGVQPGDPSHVSSPADFVDDIKDSISNHLKAILLVSAIAAGGVALFAVTRQPKTVGEAVEKAVENTTKTLEETKPAEHSYYGTSNPQSGSSGSGGYYYYGSGGYYGSGYRTPSGNNTSISLTPGSRDSILASKAKQALRSTWSTNQPPQYYEINQVITAFRNHDILEGDYIRAATAFYHDLTNTDAKKRVANVTEKLICRNLRISEMDKSLYDYGQELDKAWNWRKKSIATNMRKSLNALNPSLVSIQDLQNRLNVIKDELPSSALKDEYEKTARTLRDIQNPPKRPPLRQLLTLWKKRKPPIQVLGF